jgi:hypothetical protein
VEHLDKEEYMCLTLVSRERSSHHEEKVPLNNLGQYAYPTAQLILVSWEGDRTTAIGRQQYQEKPTDTPLSLWLQQQQSRETVIASGSWKKPCME